MYIYFLIIYLISLYIMGLGFISEYRRKHSTSEVIVVYICSPLVLPIFWLILTGKKIATKLKNYDI